MIWTVSKHFKTLIDVETLWQPTIHPEAFDHLSHADKLADEEAEEEPGDSEECSGVPEAPGVEQGQLRVARVVVQRDQDDRAQDHEEQADQPIKTRAPLFCSLIGWFQIPQLVLAEVL